MATSSNLNRRDFLRLTGLGAATWVAGQAGTLAPAVAAPMPATGGPRARRRSMSADLELVLRATPSEAQLFPGAPTRVWTYRASLLRGGAANLQTLPNSYLGPIVRVRRGQTVRVHFVNELPGRSIIHWHGLRVPAAMDGHPRDAVAPGRSYTYEFPVLDRAGTYWFHPHPDTMTGPQVYGGLAGLFLVSDEEEDAAGLPTGEFDLPLVIQDRTVDRANQLVYPLGSMAMDQTQGFLGERILVNGQPGATLTVATRPYRLRLLNGSNSRIYKLAWSDGTPLVVIGTDGGLLEAPVTREYVTLAPGERVDLWADFSGRATGTSVRLQSLAFSGVEGAGGGGHGGHPGAGGAAGSLPNGAPFPVLAVQVTQKSSDRLTLPARLSAIRRYRREEAVNGTSPRTFAITFRHMQWLLNGRKFEMEQVAENEVVRLNTLEAWEFVNQTNSGEMMHPMGMAHPLHIHGVQFQVLERQVLPELQAGWESVRRGYIDEGWKDTLLLMPGERVKLLMRFESYPGLYVYHCHNLEHEDMGMMRNYLIRARSTPRRPSPHEELRNREVDQQAEDVLDDRGDGARAERGVLAPAEEKPGKEQPNGRPATRLRRHGAASAPPRRRSWRRYRRSAASPGRTGRGTAVTRGP